ncbi:MAG TPA: DUF3106 domain-containing protein [Verrucomicrobiae bacterium]|nr:DUF3106 domain-containing protein [Verrucomicrobiae bacterium]
MKHTLVIALTAATFLSISPLLRGQEPQPPAPARHQKPPMTDEQRAQLEQQLNETWNNMPLEGKQRLMRFHRALNEMPPEERRIIRDRIDHFLNMSPQEREQLKKNAERWQAMTPEERQQARERFRQRRREFEEKWRQEHPGEEPPPFPFRPQSAPPPPPPPTSEPGN